MEIDDYLAKSFEERFGTDTAVTETKEWRTEAHPMKSFEPDQEEEMKAEAGSAGWYDANMKWAADTELPYRRQRAFEQIVGQIRVHRLLEYALIDAVEGRGGNS